MDRLNQMMRVQREAFQLFKKKNEDKINRLTSVTNNGVNLVDNESLRDTLIDLHNYSAMAIMLLDEDNKSEK